MKRVAFIAALPEELKPLVRGWERVAVADATVRLWHRQDAKVEWLAGCAGTGAAAVARVWSELEKRGELTAVGSLGFAGALNAKCSVGRAYRLGGVVDIRTGERFPAAAEGGAHWLATSDRVINAREKPELAATWGADLVDMEAAAVARWAMQRGIPFHGWKGVTDGPAEVLPDFNRFIAATGEFQRGRFIRFALLRPALWPVLRRLGKNSAAAAQALRRAVRSSVAAGVPHKGKL